jgi:rubrerythrin
MRNASIATGGLLFVSVVALGLSGCSKEKGPPPPPAESKTPSIRPELAPVPQKAPQSDLKPARPRTMKNIESALNGESNAKERYAAFATKARAEGYEDVANLFRAAARAEEIHATALAALIVKMGEKPAPDVQAPVVKSTAENLKAALEGETEEFETTYPAFIEAAKAEGEMDALRVFTGAKAAEESHAKFYKDASDNLEKWKADTRTFFVCGVCGYTVIKIDFEKCPICFAPKDMYEKIL